MATTVVRAIYDLYFATPLLQRLAAAAVLSLATHDEVQRYNRDDAADEGSPCRTNALLVEKARQTRVLEHSIQLNADPLRTTRGQATKQFSTDFRLRYSCVPNVPRKSTEIEAKTTNSTQLAVKSGIQTHPVERYSSCRYNERQLVDVTVVRRVRPRAECSCDCEGHRRWKRAGRTLFCNIWSCICC